MPFQPLERPPLHNGLLLALLPAIFLVFYGLYPPDQPPITPDSPTYLNFDALRTGGYPFFLALLKPIMREMTDYLIAQRVLYALAVFVLGFELLRSFGSLWLALAAQAALLFNPEVERLHFDILTESIFLSVSALFVAATLVHLRRGGLLSLAFAAALAGCAAAIRPTGFVFLPALAMLAAARPARLWRSFIVGAAAAVAVLALEALYYRAHHDGARQTLLPFHMLGKAGMVDIADPAAVIAGASSGTKPLQRALETGLGPMRTLIAGAPSEAARCILLAHYETEVQYRALPDERATAMAEGGPDALWRAGWARLRHGLPHYFRNSTDHLYCLWTAGVSSLAEEASFVAYLESRRPWPRDLDFGRRPSRFAFIARPSLFACAALLAVAAFALLAALVRRRQPSTLLATAGICGLLTHGGLILSALTGVGVARYVLGLWVPLAIGVGLSALWLMTLALPSPPALRR